MLLPKTKGWTLQKNTLESLLWSNEAWKTFWSCSDNIQVRSASTVTPTNSRRTLSGVLTWSWSCERPTAQRRGRGAHAHAAAETPSAWTDAAPWSLSRSRGAGDVGGGGQVRWPRPLRCRFTCSLPSQRGGGGVRLGVSTAGTWRRTGKMLQWVQISFYLSRVLEHVYEPGRERGNSLFHCVIKIPPQVKIKLHKAADQTTPPRNRKKKKKNQMLHICSKTTCVKETWDLKHELLGGGGTNTLLYTSFVSSV